MRFQVSQVMDAIEQRLTTDVTGAQAVVDVGAVVRQVDLDHGRPVNLVRIGMVVDALARYLVDGGAMLYGVVERALLSEQAFTSKERMVLGRWADDGLIEVTSRATGRAVEVADITGLPLITLAPPAELMATYRWLGDGTGRVLQIAHRAGIVVLTPMAPSVTSTSAGGAATSPSGPVIGRASVVRLAATGPPAEPAAGAPEAPPAAPAPESTEAGDQAAEATPAAAEEDPATDPPATAAEATAAEETAAEATEPEEQVGADEEGAAKLIEMVEAGQPAGKGEPVGAPAATSEEAPGPAAEVSTAEDKSAAEPEAPAEPPEPPTAEPLPLQVFGAGGAAPTPRTRISWHRFVRTDPDPAYARLLSREWRCESFDCAAFGEHRLIGQPVPRLREQVPVCPRHDEPMSEVGPRPPAYPVSIVVDDLPRQRIVVRAGRPQPVGRVDDDPDVLSVAPWLHGGAAAWISAVHLRLEAGPAGLTVTDLSDNGTVVWQRKGPDESGRARALHGESVLLGEWDSVELYTGIELVRGDRRIAGVLGRDELASVLRDAPTAAYHQVGGGD